MRGELVTQGMADHAFFNFDFSRLSRV